MPEFGQEPCQIRGSEFEHELCKRYLKVILTFKFLKNGNKIEYPFLWQKNEARQ